MFIALAMKWFRPGREMVSVVFRGERVRPCPQPGCPGLFLWKTYRYGDEPPPPPPWPARDGFLVLSVARAAGRTSRRRLVYPQMGSQEASNKQADGSLGQIGRPVFFVRRDEPAASLLRPTAWGDYHDRADNESKENVRVSPKRRQQNLLRKTFRKSKMAWHKA